MEHPIDVLIQTLRDDRTRILSGDIAGVLALSNHREEQFRKLESVRNLTIGRLKLLKGVALSNAILLQSAIRGMKEAQARFGVGHNKAATLSTYNRTGSSKTHMTKRSLSGHRV